MRSDPERFDIVNCAIQPDNLSIVTEHRFQALALTKSSNGSIRLNLSTDLYQYQSIDMRAKLEDKGCSDFFISGVKLVSILFASVAIKNRSNKT